MSRRFLSIALIASLISLIATTAACRMQPGSGANDAARSYIFAWTADEDTLDSDFLAVVDADPDSPSYGDVVRTVPVRAAATMAHHTEHVMPTRGRLFANGFTAGQTFMFDLSDPLTPSLFGSFTIARGLTYPHSYERLPSGNVLATFQTEGEGNARTGGLAELAPDGEVVRISSGADASVDDPVRPYSLTVLPDLDRVVSTSADMRGESTSRAVQVWRLSDLSLIKTILLPLGERADEPWLVGEPRVLADGRSVLVGTFSCGLYLIEGLNGMDPGARLVHTFPFTKAPECALAARIDNYWVQTVPSINGLISLDITDPSNPTEVDRLEFGDGMWPHWISPDSETGARIVVTGYRGMKNRVMIVNFDPGTGELSLDTAFGDAGQGADFSRNEWPHGNTGSGIPHGAVFSRAAQQRN